MGKRWSPYLELVRARQGCKASRTFKHHAFPHWTNATRPSVYALATCSDHPATVAVSAVRLSTMGERSPQAFLSSYAPRLRAYANSLLTPVIPQSTQLPPLSRTTKRGTTAINYAENEYDDDDIFEDDAGPKRLTGLRSRREDPNQAKEVPDKFGRELYAPVNVQGIWRDWMNKPKLVR